MTPALEAAAQRLIEVGIPAHVTAGIIANFAHESGGDPEAVGDNGSSIGLPQWHAERATAFMDFAEKHGLSVKDPGVQIDYVLRELATSERGALEELAKTTSPAQAADVFQRRFERPKVIDPARSETAAAALGWMVRKGIVNPANFAERVYMERGGTAGGGDIHAEVGPNALGLPPVGKIAQTAATFERAGVDPSIAAVVPSVAGRTAVKIAETLPGGGTLVGKPLSAAMEQAERAVRAAATKLGPIGTVETAGAAARQGVDIFKGQFAQQADDLYKAVAQHIPPDMSVFLAKTMQTLGELRGKFPTNPAVGDIVTPAAFDRLGAALNGTGGKLTWSEAQALRADIGRKLGAPQLLGDATHGQMKQLYAALADDLGLAAKAVGGPAESAWNAANSFYREGAKTIERHLSAIWDATPAQAYDRILAAARNGSRQDIGKLRALQEALPPDHFGEVTSTIVREMGRPKPGSATAQAGGEFSPTSLVTEFGKLVPAAKDVLFGKIGTATRDAIEDAVLVARNQAGIEAAANSSGTARWVGVGGVGAGAMADPVSTALGLAGGLAAGRALVSPTVGRVLKSVPARREIAVKGIAGALASGQHSQDLKAALREAGEPVRLALVRAGFTPKRPSSEFVIGQEDRGAIDAESGRQFTLAAVELLSDPQWDLLAPEDQRARLADAHRRAVKAALDVHGIIRPVKRQDAQGKARPK